MASGIYIIRNQMNQCVYVGQSVCIEERLIIHKAALRGGYHYNAHLQRAFNKYGEAAFEFRQYLLCPVEKLDDWEKILISICKAVQKSYNIEDGGRSAPFASEETKKKISEAKKGVVTRSGFTLSDEHKKKISIANKGKVRTAEQKESISQTLKDFYAENDNPFLGKKHSEETRKKMSESKKGKKWTLAQYNARGLS